MKMNTYVLLFAVILTLCGSTIGRTISKENNNYDNSISSDSKPVFEPKDWVKITEAPPAHITKPIGSTIILECEAAGSPPPTIKWIRGHGTSANVEDLIESNLITESSSNTLARVRSRLVIEHITTSDRTYTCVGRAGSQFSSSSTTISSTIGAKPHNYTEYLSMTTHLTVGPKKPTIVYYYIALLIEIGSNIVLPCQTVGRPLPEVYWLDNDDKIVNGQNPRVKVLNDGSLFVSELRWADMGQYTCVAKNGIAKDSISTFVYPVSA